MHTVICTCKLSNNQLQINHPWLVHEDSSSSARDQFENSGQALLEAVLRLMYVPTLTSWHVPVWVSQCHITHLQYKRFSGTCKDDSVALVQFQSSREPVHTSHAVSPSVSRAVITALSAAVACRRSRKRDQVHLWITSL